MSKNKDRYDYCIDCGQGAGPQKIAARNLCLKHYQRRRRDKTLDKAPTLRVNTVEEKQRKVQSALDTVFKEYFDDSLYGDFFHKVIERAETEAEAGNG